MLAVLFAASTFSLPALADGGVGAMAGAVAGANAGASATNNGGDSFGGAAPGAAYCTDSFVLGPIGGSKTMRECVVAQIAESAGKMGTMSHAEARAFQLKALEGLGYTLVTREATASLPDATMKSAPAAAESALPASLNLRVKGKTVTLKGEQVARYESCGTFQLDETVFKKPGC